MALHEVGGPAPNYASASSVVSGYSTYKWQWTPPNNDTHDFPAPPLYILADIAGSCYSTVDSSPTGLSGSGYISDSVNPPATYASTPGQASLGSSGVSRLLLHPSGSPALITLKPNDKSKLSGTVSGGSGILWVNISESAFPILLSSPNPFGRPDLGDGTNQFVYDAATPQGNLLLPGTVSIPGASADDTNWLFTDPNYLLGNHLDIKFDPPPSGQQPKPVDLPVVSQLQPYFLQSSAAQATVNSGSRSVPKNYFWFVGLPTQNDGFSDGNVPGYHLEIETLNGSNSQQAHIQTFFSAKASNYPGANTDNINNGFATPNWYYYYNLASKSTGSYEPGNQTQTDSTTPYAIHVQDQTYGTIPGIHVYSYTKGSTFIKYVGNIQLSGIWLYTDVCAHEKEHQTAYSDGTYAIDTTNPTKPWIWTSDNDHLDDTWEDNHFFDSTEANTTHSPPYTNENDAPDDEVVADILGLGGLLANLNAWQNDWAGPGTNADGTNYQGGLQYGATNFAIPPGKTQPVPYFLFTPATQNPDGSWSYGTPVKIWSVADLQKAAPNYITAIPTK